MTSLPAPFVLRVALALVGLVSFGCQQPSAGLEDCRVLMALLDQHKGIADWRGFSLVEGES